MTKYKGRTVRVRKGFYDEGRMAECLGPPIIVRQPWLPVLFEDEDDPEFFKLYGLEFVKKRPEEP